MTTVDAPLGVVMLCLSMLAGLAALFLAGYFKTAMLLQSRRHGREMEAQRKLADVAEASRLTELQHAVHAARGDQAKQVAAVQEALAQRITVAETNLRKSIDQNGNILAAYIGELEDRLEHAPESLHRLRG